MCTNKWLNYTEDPKSNLEWRLVARIVLRKSDNKWYGNFGLLHYPPVRGNFIPKFKEYDIDHELEWDANGFVAIDLHVLKWDQVSAGRSSEFSLSGRVFVSHIDSLSIYDLNRFSHGSFNPGRLRFPQRKSLGFRRVGTSKDPRREVPDGCY